MRWPKYFSGKIRFPIEYSENSSLLGLKTAETESDRRDSQTNGTYSQPRNRAWCALWDRGYMLCVCTRVYICPVITRALKYLLDEGPDF